MKYAQSYIDRYFSDIKEYDSKIELMNIAYGELDKCSGTDKEWIIALSEVMSWQAASYRSGVWTYYDALNGDSAEVMINYSKGNNEILEKYVLGIRNYENEELMDEIDVWIQNNEGKIYEYLENILQENKTWFYNII